MVWGDMEEGQPTPATAAEEWCTGKRFCWRVFGTGLGLSIITILTFIIHHNIQYI